MEKIDHAAMEIREMDELAAMETPIHNLHPLAKLITTIAYIFIVASFEKYQLSGMVIMVIFPILIFEITGISIITCFRKMKIILPLVCAVGLFNPFFDHVPVMQLGTLTITGGVLSMVTLMLKGVLCLMASFLLAATTTIDAICAALRMLRVPSVLVTLLLLTYRYISVMIEEVSVMTTAYKLRAPGQKGIHYSAWGSFLGQLLLRSMDRAEELYKSMVLRGFCGEFFYMRSRPAKAKDYLYTVIGIGLCLICRYYNIAEVLGKIMTGGK